MDSDASEIREARPLTAGCSRRAQARAADPGRLGLNMKARLPSIALLLLSMSSALWAGMLDGVDEIDAQFVVPQTGQPMLTMVIDEPLESEAVKKFNQKVEYYAHYARSGEVYQRLPKASRGMPVRIALVFDRQPTEAQKKIVFAARDRLVAMKFEVWLRVIDPQTRRSVEIEP